MHSQTLNLLAFLSEEATNSILEELRKGAKSELEIVAGAAVPQRTVNRHLKKLRELELVGFRASPSEPGRTGPAPRIYEVRGQSLFKFCDSADRFAHELAKAREHSIRRHVEDLPG